MSYYHSLKTFHESFQHSLPVLTYHKLGPRPRGARIKGLYVSNRLFTQQLAELQDAGYTTPPLAQAFAATGGANQYIVITFDDGYASALRYGLKPLADHQFRAIQFLVAGCIGKSNLWDRDSGEIQEPLMDAGGVREWLAAGHDIGSHSLSHPHLTRIDPGQAREEIYASKRLLEDTFNRTIDCFCYPYGDWNDEIRDLVMNAGYKAAFTTTTGVNKPEQSPFSLKRMTARYPSRSLKAVWSRIRAPAI